MKYRKKPLIVDAVQYLSARKSIPDAVCFCNTVPYGGQPHVHTLEGHYRVWNGDWIIKGIKGEFYPCNPEIFALTYEKVKRK